MQIEPAYTYVHRVRDYRYYYNNRRGGARIVRNYRLTSTGLQAKRTVSPPKKTIIILIGYVLNTI